MLFSTSQIIFCSAPILKHQYFKDLNQSELYSFQHWTQDQLSPTHTRLRIELQILALDKIDLLPSWSSTQALSGYQWCLKEGTIEQNDEAKYNSLISIGIKHQSGIKQNQILNQGDFWTLPQGLRNYTLELNLYHPHHTQIDFTQAILILSQKQKDTTSFSLTHLSPRHNLKTISQMQQKTPDRKRICSVCSTSMLLDQTQNIDSLLTNMHDPFWNIYGLWPRALWAANLLHFNGYLSFCNSFNEFKLLLNQGPIAASISYKKNELSGAAIESTPGHLVVIGAIQQNQVLCYDPAAPEQNQVPRFYDLMEFWKAWQNNRGFFYCFFIKK